jgi:hypothetical protein
VEGEERRQQGRLLLGRSHGKRWLRQRKIAGSVCLTPTPAKLGAVFPMGVTASSGPSLSPRATRPWIHTGDRAGDEVVRRPTTIASLQGPRLVVVAALLP